MWPFDTKRPQPCIGCKLYDHCAVEKEDCFAFRRWVNEGDYTDKQIGRLMRDFIFEEDLES